MNPVRFCMVLHLHQPVGNFGHVFEEHAVDVYRPFFDFLEDRDLWPIGLHVSGPLIEWLGEHDADLHDRIGRLASDGRAELLSAGWYEPVLAALSVEDRATQLGWMREELERRFGVTPTAAWLTERVWEPEIAADLSRAGIERVLLDDHLARRGGVPDSELDRPVRVEWDGHGLDVLPIDERLRYLIPFRPADELGADLRARQERGQRIALLGDDGEKFGGWPRTKEWLYEGGWLQSFGDLMDELRSDDVVRWVRPDEASDGLESYGPVELPPGSYPEMDGWAPGGRWTGFFDRYAESARIQARVTHLSGLCRERGDPEPVRRAIARAQCNDAYWHGVFGGVYMKHLREGVRREATLAERLLREGEGLGWSPLPDGAPAGAGWWVHASTVSAWVDARFGGTVSELIGLDRGFDAVDVLTRRREAYHHEAVERVEATSGDVGSDAPAGEAPSIHDIEVMSTLDRLPPEDRDVRTLVRDRVLRPQTDEASYVEAEYEPMWEASRADASDPVPSTVDGVDALEFHFRTPEGPAVEKWIRIAADGRVEIRWLWAPDDFDTGSWFAPEFSLGAAVDLRFDGAEEVWRFPIVTISKCPDGFEQIEQGESVTPRWPVSAGEARVQLQGR